MFQTNLRIYSDINKGTELLFNYQFIIYLNVLFLDFVCKSKKVFQCILAPKKEDLIIIKEKESGEC